MTVKYIGNPVVNHKVEQFVRAIVLQPHEIEGNTLPYARNGQLLHEHQPLDVVQIGIADEYGYRLYPTANSLLAAWGYHGNAVLFRLSQTAVEGVPTVVDHGGKLYAPFAAVVAVAYECSTPANYKAVLNNYQGYVRKFGHPSHFAVGINNAKNALQGKAQKPKAVR